MTHNSVCIKCSNVILTYSPLDEVVLRRSIENQRGYYLTRPLISPALIVLGPLEFLSTRQERKRQSEHPSDPSSPPSPILL